MKQLTKLFFNNREWVAGKLSVDKYFFKKLSSIQNPEFLWIGCSDSRVPANEIVGLQPGELFVHRNVANVVEHTDINCLSVIQYAVEVLEVKHIIVCGHYGCGGVKAALENQQLGLIDNWLRNIKDVYRTHQQQIEPMKTQEERLNLLCELNVREQVLNVCHTSIVQNAWDRKKPLSVHGWIYDIHDGLLKDLDLCISEKKQIDEIYRVKL